MFYEIRGRLIDEDKRPLESIKLVAYKDNSTQPEAIAITSKDATFRLYLQPGEYRLSAASQYCMLASPFLSVSGNQNLGDIIGIVKRRFADEVKCEVTKKTLQNCKVKVYLKNNNGSKYTEADIIEQTETDNEGKFELLLYPGVYVVCFEKPGYEFKFVDVVVE